MIQMCVYNSILAGRLLAGPWETAGWPLGRLAATAGCTGKLLVGHWEGWLALGRLLSVLNSLNLLIFGAADWHVRFEADADFSVPSRGQS